MSREPDGDEPLAIYEMGQTEPVAYVRPGEPCPSMDLPADREPATIEEWLES